MRAFVRGAMVGSAVAAGLLIGAAAHAQVPPLPETSRSEAQVNRLNRDIESGQQVRSIQQQNQFENNQIRGQIQSAPAPVVVAPPIVGPHR